MDEVRKLHLISTTANPRSMATLCGAPASPHNRFASLGCYDSHDLCPACLSAVQGDPPPSPPAARAGVALMLFVFATALLAVLTFFTTLLSLIRWLW